MKPPAPLSAFAVYNKILKPKAIDKPSKKNKMKAKCKQDIKSAFKANKPTGKPLTREEFMKAIGGHYYPKSEKNEAGPSGINDGSTKCKHKSVKEDKSTPEIHTKSPFDTDSSSSSSNSDDTDTSTTESELGKDVGNPLKSGLEVFEWMISPMEKNKFFKTFWESGPMFINRPNTKYNLHLFSSKALDDMIRDNDLYYSTNIDIVAYADGKKEIVKAEGKAVAAAVWDMYRNGCSVRILNPQTYNRKVHLLLSTLQEYFGSMVGANVYLTPPGSQGFAPHYDDIEAFVLQIEGRKHWKIYLPRQADMLPRYSSQDIEQDELGEPFMKVTLEAGSMLYFPRGFIHQGSTDSESHSLHITVSVYQKNAYVDLLEKAIPHALAKAAAADIEFRKGLPLHFIRSNKAKKTMKQKMSELFDKLKEYLEVEDGVAELGRRLVYDSMPPVLSKEELPLSCKDGGEVLMNGVVLNDLDFDASTKVRLTRFHCIQLGVGEEAGRLYFATENSKIYHERDEQYLELEPEMIPVVKYLQKSYPDYVPLGSLPFDDMGQKVQIIYDFWERGIVLRDSD